MTSNWLSTSAAAEELGISQRQLLELRRLGILKSRKHYRKMNPTAHRPTYIWNIERCTEILENEN